MRGVSSLSQLSLSPSVYHLSLLGLRTKKLVKLPLVPTIPRCVNLQDVALDSVVKPSTRRSADYDPASWNFDYLVSLPTDEIIIMEKHEEQREKMIAEVKDTMNDSSMDALTRLELVDAIERLGLHRHFQREIKASVEVIYNDNNKYPKDLYATALRFRVLRQHGYAISEDVFDKFKDKASNFCKVSSEDTKGLLSLYEASFLQWTRDTTLDEVRAFATQHLKQQLMDNNLEGKRAKEVQQALDIPSHQRFPTLKARWSIEVYDDIHLPPTLIRLAKLDYNLLQSTYKEEIKQLARWGASLGLQKKLPYMRDRLLENYTWILGLVEEPQYHHFREMASKVLYLIAPLDDTYDVYGSIEELEVFTDLVDRWDISGIDQLPEPMKWCYLAIYNTTNEIADWVTKHKHYNILPNLSKAWARLCKEYFQEAKWYHEGYKPTLSEYLSHAYISVTVHVVLLVIYILTAPTITEEALDYIDNLPDLLHHGGMICRLTNDLGTSSVTSNYMTSLHSDELARGDTIKALQCYMNETGASEKVAKDYINGLINDSWKKMNEEYYVLPPQYPVTISEPFLSACLNFARVPHFFYILNKDWYGKPDEEMIDEMKALLINPIPLYQP